MHVSLLLASLSVILHLQALFIWWDTFVWFRIRFPCSHGELLYVGLWGICG